MSDKRLLKITDINGIVTEYEVIMTFPWHNKSYLVYTDNTYDEEGRLNILAAIYKSDKELIQIVNYKNGRIDCIHQSYRDGDQSR